MNASLLLVKMEAHAVIWLGSTHAPALAFFLPLIVKVSIK